MPVSWPTRHRVPRAWMVAFVLFAATAVAVVLVRQHRISVVQPEGVIKTGSNSLVVERIHQTSTRDGRTEWSLEAASAQYVLPEKKMILKDVAVTFFTEDGQRVYLTSRNGEVKTDSHDMEARDDVVIYNDLYRLETEQIAYVQTARMITSERPVKITGQTGEITADTLSVDLSTNRLLLKGHVRGTLVSDGTR